MNNKYKIYCDLDGVLVNFDKGYQDLTGRDISGEFFSDTHFWDPINKAGKKFWIDLEWQPDGKELWEHIKDYKPKLLSAPSREDSSRVGKHEWVERELPGVPLLLRTAKHKKDFAAPDAILIDDRLDNIEGWIEKGGIGIHHISTKETINELLKLGL
jgi:FMN phosphatase YigB (HAD superfamily)